MNLLYLSVVCKVIKSFHLKLNFRKGLSCYQLGIFFYIFIRILPGLLSTCKFLSSRSFLGCQFDNFNVYLLRLETFFDNHLFLLPGAARAEGPLSLASMQLPVFSWIGVLECKEMISLYNLVTFRTFLHHHIKLVIANIHKEKRFLLTLQVS